MKQTSSPYTGLALSGFCMQISILLKSAVPLYEGLQVMAEDAAGTREKELLTALSDQVRKGESFSHALKEAGCFPSYVEEMSVLGERTGTLDVTMEGLAAHYEKEARLAENLRRALTYPAMMVLMLLLILFVLFVKIMPVFSGVYEQLGASIPPAAAGAIRMGGIVSGIALVAGLLLVVIVAAARLFGSGNSGRSGSSPEQKSNPHLFDSWAQKLSSRSEISRMTAIRRLCGAMAVAFRCGLRLEEGFDLAAGMVEHPKVRAAVLSCRDSVAEGNSFYDAVKQAGLFTGFDLQLLRVAGRAGQLEQVLERLSDDYDERVDDALDAMVAKLEPAIVSILAVAVGLVLLSVMLPLAGILSAIG